MADKKNSIILNKSFVFAVRIIKLYQYLSNEKKEYVLSKQILKSGTSIGANVEEAHGGISGSDFSNKISLAYKESRETHYWLRLLNAADYINEKMYKSFAKDCEELCKILFSILKTTRINRNKKKSDN
jgi:four helix bundle protein